MSKNKGKGVQKILLIEDEKALVLSLSDRLECEGYDVSAEYDGINGENKAAGGGFDIILLDVMLPGRDGFQVCRNLRDKDIHTPILMLTARDTNLDTVTGLRIGADDYLAKPFDMQILLARIEALLRRAKQSGGGIEETPCPEYIDFGDFTIDTGLKQLREGGTVLPLSSQEYRLLEYLARHPDRVLSRDELLNEVWGYETSASTRTVDVHIARLRKRLGEEDEAKHIITARGHGYRFSF